MGLCALLVRRRAVQRAAALLLLLRLWRGPVRPGVQAYADRRLGRGALQALPVGRQAAAYDGDARAAVRLGVRHAPSQRVGHISALPVVGRESDVIDELPLHSRISIPRVIYAKTSTTGRDGLQCCKFYPELRWMVSPDKRASRVAPTAAAAAAAMDCTRAHRVSDAPTPRPWRPRRRGAP